MARGTKQPDPRAVVAGAVAAGAAAAAGTAARVRARRRRGFRRYRLGEDEPVPEGIRRVADGQLDLIASELDRSKDGRRDDAVHESRKSFKRLRALVRLTRDQLGPEVRRRENAAFRDAGRKLSGARDARVLVETLDELVADNRDRLQPEAFGRLRAALIEDRATSESSDDVLMAVDAARARVETWPLGGDGGTRTLEPGFKRIYRRGRRAYRTAEDDATSEHLHELRKRTKDVWHAAQVLRPAAPKRLRKLGRAAHKLSDVLGDDHDLAALLEASRKHAATLAPAERELLTEIVEGRRAKLQRKALKRARKLYSAKPRKLARVVR
jgi:CHAD domain-containing protein